MGLACAHPEASAYPSQRSIVSPSGSPCPSQGMWGLRTPNSAGRAGTGSLLPYMWPLEASVSPSVKWAPPCFTPGSVSGTLGIPENRVTPWSHCIYCVILVYCPKRIRSGGIAGQVPITAHPWWPCFSPPSAPADSRVTSSPTLTPGLCSGCLYLTQRTFGAISWTNLKPV